MEKIEVESVSSSRVTLKGLANNARVYLAPEPPPTPDALPAAAHPLLSGPSPWWVGPLAPGVSAFVTVEDESGRRSVHVRTPGGPGAKLDGPIRSVHGVGPRTLCVTVAELATWNPHKKCLEAENGAAWQAGRWTLARASGRTVPITAIHRHSFPVGQPVPALGYGKTDESRPEWNRIEVDHRLFLTLGEPLGEAGVLWLAWSVGAVRGGLWLPWSDRYLEALSIQVNQVGYRPGVRRRYAYVSMWLGDGGGLSLDDLPKTGEVLAEPLDPLGARTVVLSGVGVDARSARDREAGAPVRQLDLGRLPALEGGRYRVHVPGVGVSAPTAVSWQAVFKAAYTVMRGLTHSRRGRELTPASSDWGPRPPDHGTAWRYDGPRPPELFPAGTPKETVMRTRGGHHDGGAFELRSCHPIVASYLLRASELAGERQVDGQLDVPERGNGQPDLLDEALWSLGLWLDLQSPRGAVRGGLASARRPSGVYFADEDPLPYWTFPEDGEVTARAGAAMAHAARLLAKRDPARSAELSRRAVRAFTEARRLGASPAGLAHIAGELHQLFPSATLRQAFESAVEGHFFRTDGRSARWLNVPPRDLQPEEWARPGQAHVESFLAYARSVGGNEPRVAAYRRLLSDVLDSRRAQVDRGHAHRCPRGEGWDGGQGAHPARGLVHLFALLQLGPTPQERADILDVLSLSADWTLGCNPAGRVWFTGLGARSPQEPVHLDALASRAHGKGTIPGIAVYGPAPGRADQDPRALAAFYPPFAQHPAAVAYGDCRGLAACNGASAWELQGPSALLFAALLPDPTEHAPMRASDFGFQPTGAGGRSHRSPLPPHTAEPAPVTTERRFLRDTPLTRLRGVGAHWRARAERAGVRTIGEAACAGPGPLLAGQIAAAKEVLELGEAFVVRPELAGRRCAEVRDEALAALAVRLDRRWFGRLRVGRLGG